MKRCGWCLWLMVLLFAQKTFAQRVCVKDEALAQPIESFLISSDGNTWMEHVACFDFPEGVDTLYIKAEGYHLLALFRQSLSTENPIVFLKPDYHTLEEVVITPNRIQEKKRDIPQELHVLKASEIYRLQAPTMADVLQQSGEVFVQKSQVAGGSPVLRGFEANRILLVVDGVRMNNLMFRAGHLQNIISVDPFVLDNTDVLMGPSSVMYGSDAMGGVIHMRSRKPSFLKNDSAATFTGQALIRGYSASRGSHYHTDFEIRKKKWASLSSFTFYQSADLRAGKYRPDSYGDWGKDTFYVARVDGRDSVYENKQTWVQRFSGYKQSDFMQKGLLKTGENSKLLLCVQYSVSGDLPRYDRLEQIRNGAPRYAEWYYGPQKRVLSYAKWETATSTKLYDKWFVLAAWQYFRESRHNRNLNAEWLQNRTERATVASLNVDFSKKIGKHELRYGAEGTWQGLRSEAYQNNLNTGEQENIDTRYPDGGSGMNTAGLYVFDAAEVSRKWIVQGALRYNFTSLNAQLRDTTFFKFPFSEIRQQQQALNGSASLIWLPSERIKNVVQFSSAFKSPNVDDLTKIFESTPGNIIIPNENIQPERTYTLEYGLDVVNSKIYHVQARTYYTWYQDIMSLKPDMYQGLDSIFYDGVLSRVMSMQNSSEGFIYGAYSSLWLKWRSLEFTQSATITTGQILSDTGTVYLDHIPPFVGKTAIRFAKKRFTSELSALYNGMKPIREFSLSGEDNEDQTLKTGSPSWMIFTWRNQVIIQDNLIVSFAIENITDRYYRPFASGVAGAGRNFVIGVKGVF